MEKTRKILLLGFALAVVSCGVKGDPVPPETPAEIGRGKPVFKGDDEKLVPPAERRDFEDTRDQESEDSENK